MSKINRRQWLAGVGTPLLGGWTKPSLGAESADSPRPQDMSQHAQPLLLSEYEPKSLLHVPKTHVPRARFPVIDVHTHLSVVAVSKNGISIGEKMSFGLGPDELLPMMDRRNIRMFVDLTGGVGRGLKETIERYHKPHPDRFLVFVEPWYARANEPGYPQFQADEIERAHQMGARGLKVVKTLGLYLRQGITTGPLVKVDDHRFDLMWEACGAMKMPVAIHTADPDAFFLPIDRFNERYENLERRPHWSFYGHDYPPKKDLLEARNRVFARHPKTHFIALHIANHSENLEDVSEVLDRYPNVTVEMAARINELGRQPRTARKFFDKYQDQIYFGTDSSFRLSMPQPEHPLAGRSSHGPQRQVVRDDYFMDYFRFLETEDEYFPYSPNTIPPQGRWRIYGIGLPDTILRKVYNENCSRLLGLSIG
jgi:predicted TIM-barrel fold metal-dependent hydrolase